MDQLSLKQVLAEIDDPNMQMSEHRFRQYLKDIEKNSLSELNIKLLELELLAFNFCEDYDWSSWGANGWGTYFGPMEIWRNGNGDPHKDEVTADAIAYWSERLKEAQHPVLKIRYASLVWEFRKQSDDQTRAFEAARSISNSTFEMVSNHLHEYESDTPLKLKYALKTTLSILSIKNKDGIKQLKDTILDYEKNYVKRDAAINAWSISFDCLLDHNQISLTEQEENGIIERIEKRLERLLSNSVRITDLNAARGAVERLCEYYNKKRQPNKLQKIFSEYRTFICKQENLNAPAFDISNLHIAYQLAERFNLKSDKHELALTLMATGKNITQNARIHTDVTETNQHLEIPPEMISAPKEACFRPLAVTYIPKDSMFQDSLDTLKKIDPMLCHSQIAFVNKDGRMSSSLSGVSHDNEESLFYAASLFIFSMGASIYHITKHIMLKHNLSVEFLLDYLYRGHCFHENKKEIISCGLNAYLKEDPITAMHILIPQVEACLRIILDSNAVPSIQKNKSDGYNVLLLDPLLRDQRIVDILGSDTVFYFRVLISNQNGLNLRNDVCHGIAAPATFTMENASLIFHVLLILSEKTATEK